jgi:hypothetical protein
MTDNSKVKCGKCGKTVTLKNAYINLKYVYLCSKCDKREEGK